jgi:hypothetical protein
LGDPAEAAGALIDLGVRTVVVKMGGDGCVVMSEDGNSFHLPAFKVEVVGAPFSCDAYVFNLFTKTPAFVLGPGGDHTHAPDEYVLVRHMLDIVHIYARAIVRWRQWYMFPKAAA